MGRKIMPLIYDVLQLILKNFLWKKLGKFLNYGPINREHLSRKNEEILQHQND